VRRVDPNFLYVGVIQERLQRTEPGYGIKDMPAGSLQMSQRRKGSQESPFVIVVDGIFDQAPNIRCLFEGI
jgi:hypothetical protein